MNWTEFVANPPSLTMAGLLAFMERWQPGVTAELRPATAEQMSALAAPHGGIDVLPPIYRAFLETMGASMGPLRLTRGSTAITDLLEDLDLREGEGPDPSRYLKFAIGEDDYDGRQPDDFFDLSRPSADAMDAEVFRIHEHDLVRQSRQPRHPFASFSDLVRSVMAVKLSVQVPREPCDYFSFDAGSMPKIFELLIKMGFAHGELGGSIHCVPLEAPNRGAVAILSGPSDMIPRVGLRLRTDEPKQLRLIQEIIADHKPDLEAG